MKKVRIVIVLLLVIVVATVTFPVSPQVYAISSPGVALDKEEISEFKNIAAQEKAEDEKTAFLENVFERFGVDASFAGKVNEFYKDRFYHADEIYGKYKGNNAEVNSDIMPLSSGSNEKYYDKMDLAIIYAKNGTRITMLGFFTWKEMPWMRSDDIISIGTPGGSINQEEALLYVQYSNRLGQDLEATFHEGYDTDECTYIGECATAAFEYNLPDNITSMSAMIGSEVTYSLETTITAQYFHKKFLGNISVSVSYGAGLSVGPERLVDEYKVQCGVV